MLCIVEVMILIVSTEDVSSSMTLTLNNKVIFKLICSLVDQFRFRVLVVSPATRILAGHLIAAFLTPFAPTTFNTQLAAQFPSCRLTFSLSHLLLCNTNLILHV